MKKTVKISREFTLEGNEVDISIVEETIRNLIGGTDIDILEKICSVWDVKITEVKEK